MSVLPLITLFSDFVALSSDMSNTSIESLVSGKEVSVAETEVCSSLSLLSPFAPLDSSPETMVALTLNHHVMKSRV